MLLARRGLAGPIGPLTQLGKLPLADGELPFDQALPLAGLDQLEFGGWDVFADDAYAAAPRRCSSRGT